jgi:phosphoribosyl 1,2-cyclic phosphate phosphodiesterase
MTLEVTILGCGSSTGVPRIGGPDGAGDWGACDPANPKNRRLRCSVLVRQKSANGETAVLVDTSPDMRHQMLAARCARLNAVFITHDHADQTHGFDDLRFVAYGMRKRVDVYSDKAALDSIQRKFGYAFEGNEKGGYPAIVAAKELTRPFQQIAIAGEGGTIPVLPFTQGHGSIHSLGFRFGAVAYSSDVNTLDEEAFAALAGVDCWIVDCLRRALHPSHANLDTALGWIARVKPKRAVLTNMHIDLDYEALKRALPPGIEPAYDGMTIVLES